MGLRNQDVGLPDGGLVTLDQLSQASLPDVAESVPARGVIEAKPPIQL